MSPFVLNKLSFVHIEYDWGKGWDRKSEDFIPCLCKTVDHPPYRTWVRVRNQGLSERLDFDSHDLQMSHPGGRGVTKNRERTLQIVQTNELLRFGYRFSFDVLSMRVEENKHQQDIF